jgi:cytoskeleton protein RodZ
VADVSQQIKYGSKQIAAIEADDYAKLPGATFVRGMIRSYAKLVQIDPKPLLVDLGRRDIPGVVTVDLRTSGQEPFVESGAKSNRVYVLLSIAALLAVAVVAYQWWANPLDTGVVVTIMPKTAKDDAGDAAPVPADSPPPEPAPATGSPAPVSLAEPVAPDAARAAEPSTQTQTAAPAGAAAGSVGDLSRIELQFDELSWVEIKQADGKILLSQLNRPGTMQVVEGVPPFDVVIGNAAKVRVKYNDTPLDLRPFFKVDVARLKLE